jgi:hypothetical protein
LVKNRTSYPIEVGILILPFPRVDQRGEAYMAALFQPLDLD